MQLIKSAARKDTFRLDAFLKMRLNLNSFVYDLGFYLEVG